MLNKIGEDEVMFGDKVCYYKPNKMYEYNFMLDTCVIKHIVQNLNLVDLFIKSLEKGYRFYKIDVQDREINGIIDRKQEFSVITPIYRDEAVDFLDRINAKRVSCIATLLHNFTVLDGSMRYLEDNGLRANLVNDVYNHNLHHLKDAVIAEATIYNDCILVSNDKRLVNKVNKHFVGRALMLQDFINKYING